MFPRGPRFPPTKEPDVPGPNTYNLNQESQLDSYKRGAFLERADRFFEAKVLDTPGLGAHDTHIAVTTKHTSKQVNMATANERYAALQRRLEDLEKVHAEGRKAHAAELERLKSELSRMQKSNAEQIQRTEKLKKHNDNLEMHLQELRKLNLKEQSEIRDLRVKLRVSEHERGQLASKQSETGDAKKTLAALEAKGKEEIKERDKKIAELEKSVSEERKKRIEVEAKLEEVRGNTDGEVEAAREKIQTLESRIKDAMGETQTAVMRAHETGKREEQLIDNLENARSIVHRVAEEYGRLAASTVSLKTHREMKHERDLLSIQVFRLERKLANSEAQVVELAHLIRGTKDQKDLMLRQLTDAYKEIEWNAGALRQANAFNSESPLISDHALEECAAAIETEFTSQTKNNLETEIESRRLFSQYDVLQHQDILRHYATLSDELKVAQEQSRTHEIVLSTIDSQRDQLRVQLEVLQKEHEVTCRQAAEYSACWEESKTREDELKREMKAREKEHQTATAIIEEKLKKERESVVHLTSTLQQTRTAEESLREEIDQLTSDLTEVERYQDAYNTLVEEVDALIDRNALAEDEAKKLSKFNAEILGHSNPSQRIMYVDRIRKELAETKQNLLVVMRERNSAYATNDDLRQELDMYKSVTVPIQEKPRTMITRVVRAPLTSHDLNLDKNSENFRR